MEVLLILLPAIMALLSVTFSSGRVDRFLLIAGAVAHLVITLGLPLVPAGDRSLLGADGLSYPFLLVLTLLFTGSALYSVNFTLDMERENRYDRWYAPSMLFFLGAMSGVILSRNLGLMWVFVEATTLSNASLIYHHKNKESLEAVWKYLFICSIGIALAFIGVIAMIEAKSGLRGVTMNIDQLVSHAPELLPLWTGLAFVFILVGYGTKMGLAPMHTWLPDAHSQAPSPASALFSGTLLNCAFLAILRYFQIISHTSMIHLARWLILILGVCSLIVAAVYVYRVANFKRKLAYSSIEHMGILAVCIGLGGAALYAAMLHMVCHSLAKHLMFLTAGNYYRVYHTVDTNTIRAGLYRIPASARLSLLGSFALLGFPPFGTFISEFLLVRQMVGERKWILLVLFVVCVIVVAYGIIKAVTDMAFAAGSEGSGDGTSVPPREREPLLSILPQCVFIVLLVLMGLSIPDQIESFLRTAAALLGGS